MNSVLSIKSLGFCFLSQARYLLLAWLAVYGLKIELSRNKHAPDYKMRRICLFSDNSVFLNIPFPVCVRLYQLGGMMAPKGRHQQKKNVFFRALPESPTPPLTPIRATWSFFLDVKIQDLKVTCGEGREIY